MVKKRILQTVGILLITCLINMGTIRMDSEITMIRSITYNTQFKQIIEINKTYGGSNWDSIYSIITTPDGGYALAGTTSSYGNAESNIWLIKTDDKGQVEWNQSYGGLGNDGAYSVVSTTDGGFAMAGWTNSFSLVDYDMVFVKTDKFGNLLWNRTYGGKNDDIAYSMIPTSDGGYILAGFSDSYSKVNETSDMWVVKVNSTGQIEWNQTYGGEDDDGARSIIATKDGGYAIAGYTSSYSLDGFTNDMWLVKTTISGNVEWNKTYGGNSRDEAYSILATKDGGYALVGSTFSFNSGVYSQDIWFVKTNTTGLYEWDQTYGGKSFDFVYSAAIAEKGGYILAGQTYSYGAGNGDMWIIAIDSMGLVEWNQTYGGTATDAAFSVITTEEGSYILAGYTFSFGIGNNDAWFIKFKTKKADDLSILYNLVIRLLIFVLVCGLIIGIHFKKKRTN